MPATKRIETIFESWLTGLAIGRERPNAPMRIAADTGWVRAWIGPFCLLLVTPVIPVATWMACFHYQGSIVTMIEAEPSDWWKHLPVPTLTAVKILSGWIVAQALLLKLLPGPAIRGPITPTGAQPLYRQNGIPAWIVTHGGIFGVAWPMGWLDPGSLYEHYGSLLALLVVTSLVFCLFLYWKGRCYPSSGDAVYSGNLLLDFFQGVELHPQLVGFDLKQLLNCRVSMMGWSVICCCFLIAQHERHGAVSTGMWASVIVLVVYLFKFFWWEDGYLHSLDIMHDRFGYYICWGVLAWVPSVYCLPAMWLVDHPSNLPVGAAAAVVALGVGAIWMNYDADAQRRRVRTSQGKTTVWGKAPELITARYTTADGQQRENLLLVSGWWGIARHFHYIPELLAAAAWTLPAGLTHFLPWFYWLFLAILLTDRTLRDERRCAKKYGADWQEYARRVPWRVLPGFF